MSTDLQSPAECSVRSGRSVAGPPPSVGRADAADRGQRVGLPSMRIIVSPGVPGRLCLVHRALVTGDPAGHRAFMEQCVRRMKVFACRPKAGNSPDGPGRELSSESPAMRRHDGTFGSWDYVGGGADGVVVITGVATGEAAVPQATGQRQPHCAAQGRIAGFRVWITGVSVHPPAPRISSIPGEQGATDATISDAQAAPPFGGRADRRGRCPRAGCPSAAW